MFEIITGLDVQKAIKSSGLSQAEVSRRLGFTKNGLSYTLRSNKIKLDIFQRICQVISVHPCMLWTSEIPNKKGVKMYFNEKDMPGSVVAENEETYIPKTVDSTTYYEMKKRYEEEIHFLRQLNMELLKR